jgi:hypothetical protein
MQCYKPDEHEDIELLFTFSPLLNLKLWFPSLLLRPHVKTAIVKFGSTRRTRAETPPTNVASATQPKSVCASITWFDLVEMIQGLHDEF